MREPLTLLTCWNADCATYSVTVSSVDAHATIDVNAYASVVQYLRNVATQTN